MTVISTSNTVKELTSQWKNSSGENVGLLYADSKTKEVHSVRCSTCSGTGATASLDNLKSILPEASSKGNVIGAWHTHPENGFQASTNIDKEDVTNPAVAIPSFASGALGIIVNRNTITPYSINVTMTSYTENDQDEITKPKYSPNYSDFKNDFQNPVFTNNVNSKTYWNQ